MWLFTTLGLPISIPNGRYGTVHTWSTSTHHTNMKGGLSISNPKYYLHPSFFFFESRIQFRHPLCVEKRVKAGERLESRSWCGGLMLGRLQDFNRDHSSYGQLFSRSILCLFRLTLTQDQCYLLWVSLTANHDHFPHSYSCRQQLAIIFFFFVNIYNTIKLV